VSRLQSRFTKLRLLPPQIPLRSGKLVFMGNDPGPRVVLCTPGFPSSVNDTDKPFLLDHARALSDANFRVTVICPAVPGTPSRQTLEGIEVLRVRYGPRRLETLAATGAMYREARGLKSLLVVPMLFALCLAAYRQTRAEPAVLHGHWWIPGGLVATFVGWIARCPSVVHVHGSDAVIANSPALKWLARRVFVAADTRLAVSAQLARWGQQMCSKDFDVLPMPVNLNRVPDPSAAPEHGFVLAVGRLVPEKGFDVLIDAVAIIDSRERPSLTIIGIGPERENLKRQAQKLGVDLHLAGAVPPSEINDWYMRCRFVAVPSLREGFGLVAAEAAAASRAVVGTKVGGLEEIVDHGVSGLLVEPGDSRALATALLEVDADWGLRGPDQVVQLSSARHGKQMRRLYEDLSK
jgi:glycosyltransferase involved in cell wall biosynthesis